MKIKIAELECSYGGLGAIVDCEPRVCYLCSYYRPIWFKEKEVTSLELKDMIASFKYVIKCI